MKIYFITYGSGQFLFSAKIISKKAESLNLFSKVFVFSEDDLPLSIKSSPLFHYNKGGGFWLWKPYIIDKVLNEIEEGDIVVYSDAGNQLFNSDKWYEYFNLLETYNSIFFQYKENYDYGWNKFNSKFNDSPKLKFWIKQSTVNHFTSLFSSDSAWLEQNKILAGLIFVKKNKESQDLIRNWKEKMLFFPQLVFDVFEDEKNNQIAGFAEHRHDQSIISSLVRYYEKSKNILVLDEEFETYNEFQIVRTSRKVFKKKSFLDNFLNILRRIKKRIKLVFK